MLLFSYTGRMLFAVLALFSAIYTASADTAPGIVNVDLIFPLNNTYDTFDGPMPVVFAVSRPDIASILQLEMSYLLSLESGKKTVFDNAVAFNFSSGPIPPTKNNGDGEYAFYVDFSNASIAGVVGKFRMELIFTYIVDYPGDPNRNIPQAILGVPIIYDMFFTTAAGATPGIVPGMENITSTTNGTNSTNTTPCMPVGSESFYFPINITGFITENGSTFGMVPVNGEINYLPQCAVEVDPDTALLIASGPTTATATGTGATGSSTANAGISGPVPHSFAPAVLMAVAMLFAFLGGELILL